MDETRLLYISDVYWCIIKRSDCIVKESYSSINRLPSATCSGVTMTPPPAGYFAS